MKKVQLEQTQRALDEWCNVPVYVHLETTHGAYASHMNEGFFNTGAFIRNALVTYTNATITPDFPHRVGLKTTNGWVYAQGITHWTINERNELLLAGIDPDGKLAVALQLSKQPFRE